MVNLRKTKWQHGVSVLLFFYLAVGLPILHSVAHDSFHHHSTCCEHTHEHGDNHAHELAVADFIHHHDCPICTFWLTNHLVKSDSKQKNLVGIGKKILLPKVQVRFRYVLKILPSCRAPPHIS